MPALPLPSSKLPIRFCVTALLFISFAALAHGQVRQQKPLPEEALERAEDAPVYVWRTELSPRMVSRFDAFTSYQVNVNANGLNITGDAANEPSISVDPTNPNKMAIGWRQFNSVASNFRQGGWGYTTNGGTAWTFPGVLENNVFRSDPVFDSDSSGAFFYLSLIQNFYDDMWRSLNGGMSWVRLGPATGGDKQWFTIDKTNSTGAGFQYQNWSTSGNNYGGRQFSRSINGGSVWQEPIFMPNSPSWGTPDVDANGNVFVGGVNLNTGQFWCIRSTNAKNGAVIPTFDLSTPVNLGGDILVGEAINPEGLVGQTFLAADRSGTSTNNNVYLLASVRRFEAGNGSDVMFVRSKDSGQTFSAPFRINDDAVNDSKWHWMSTVAVAPNGRLDAVWLDTRNAANNTDSQLFYSYSGDGGITWSANVAVSQPFNPFLGYPNQNKMGDYLTMVSDVGGGNVAYTATFNGEEDIYYVRVAPPAIVPLSAASRKTHGADGTFDVPLPLTGSAGIECRSGSGANFNNHQIVVTFTAPVTVGGVSVANGDGAATATQSVSGSVVTVDLVNVTDAQTLTVTLRNVTDAGHNGDVAIRMGVLAGDTNASGNVSASDLAQTKAQSGQPVTASNFRSDVTVNGGFINGSDVSLIKARSGNVLAP